jgi:hypothetical protein
MMGTVRHRILGTHRLVKSNVQFTIAESKFAKGYVELSHVPELVNLKHARSRPLADICIGNLFMYHYLQSCRHW